MKIEITQEKNNNQIGLELRVEYSKNEWEKLLSLYEGNPEVYRKGISNDIFGANIRAEVYFLRSSAQSLAEEIENEISYKVYQKEKVRLRVIDDINRPVIYIYDSDLVLNIALFRAIPTYDENLNKYVFKVMLPERFIYLPGIRFFKYVLREYIKMLKMYHSGKKIKLIYKIEVIEE